MKLSLASLKQFLTDLGADHQQFWRFPLVLGAIPALYSFVAALLWGAGPAKSLVLGMTGKFRTLGFLLSLPGIFVLRLLGGLSCGTMHMRSLLVIAVANCLFYGIIAALLKLWWVVMRRRRERGGILCGSPIMEQSPLSLSVWLPQ